MAQNLRTSLKRRLGFWTRVVVLKMDFDKSAVKIFMSENQKLLNHLRFRNWNYRRFQVWIFWRKSRSEELCTQEKTFVTTRSFCLMHQKTESPYTPQKVNDFVLSQYSTWFFSVSTALDFSTEVSMETAHTKGCWKINSVPCEEGLENPENPKFVFGFDLSRHSNPNSPEVDIWFLLWKYLSKKSKCYVWKIL